MSGRQRRPNDAEPDGEFRRLAGRAAGVLFVLGGTIAAAEAPTLPDRTVPAVVWTVLAVGVVGVATGLTMLGLPWHRWPRRASLLVVVPALALIGLGNWIDPDPYLASAFLILVAMWLGTAHRRGTVLAFSPLLALAYWWPLAIVPHAPGLARSLLYVIPVCVLAGESLAWLTARLHTAQRRLREHDERRFEAMLAASSDTTVVLDAAGDMSYVSPSAARVLHTAAETLHGQSMAEFIRCRVHPDDTQRLSDAMANLFASASASADTSADASAKAGASAEAGASAGASAKADTDTDQIVRFRVAGADATWCDVEGVGRNLLDDEAVRGVLLNLRDVDERKQLERALTHQAFTDKLTGLPNRALLRERTEQALHLAGRHGHTAALLLIDLDRFKEVNDTLGHHRGDELLRQVAQRLAAALRETDTVARLGGDEFAVLLPCIATVEDAIAVAGKLQTSIEAPFLIEGFAMDVDASVGLATYPDHASNPDELLQRADVAMYAAKAAHLDYVVYESRLDQHSPRRLGLLGQLRRAITNDELVVYYQPKARTRSGRVIGLEALVRWQHPEYGLLGPGEFIPLAETTGVVRPLTSYVLDVAVGQCRAWHDAGYDLSVAVNVSARCLLDPRLPDEIKHTLDVHAFAAHRLVLEITESAIMSDPDRALEVLNRLHALGVQLSIDDFGTGYSSMARLKNLPVQELKVDRSFVTHMCQQQSERMIVRSAVDLAHNLGLHVVAEGVEDQETWQDLDRLGCDVVQGYHLARPMSAAQVATWLTDQSPTGSGCTDTASGGAERLTR